MLLSVESLTKKFGGLVAVNQLSLSLKKNQIAGIIGPNGAGKTTAFNLISGIYKPNSGKITFDHHDITGLKPHHIAGLGIARTFQNIRVFPYLSVLDNVLTSFHREARYGILDALLRTRRHKKQEIEMKDLCEEIIETVGLQDRRHLLARNLPYGYQRRLEIARALAISPKVLLLDEPAAGMSISESDQLCELVLNIQRQKEVSILLIEHRMNVVMSLCQRIFVLNFGSLIAVGTPSEIQENEDVINAYLGKE